MLYNQVGDSVQRSILLYGPSRQSGCAVDTLSCNFHGNKSSGTSASGLTDTHRHLSLQQTCRATNGVILCTSKRDRESSRLPRLSVKDALNPPGPREPRHSIVNASMQMVIMTCIFLSIFISVNRKKTCSLEHGPPQVSYTKSLVDVLKCTTITCRLREGRVSVLS